MKRVSLYAIVVAAVLLMNLIGCIPKPTPPKVIRVVKADIVSVVIYSNGVRTFSTQGTFWSYADQVTFKFDKSISTPTITFTERESYGPNLSVITFEDKSQYDSYVKIAPRE